MSHDGTPRSIQWAARLPHVRDVTLFGTADLDYWTRRLQAERLEPINERGRARFMIVAADSRFMGVRFREVSVSVAVQPLAADSHQEAVFLLQAYNSVRFFAFCERQLFKTPYVHGAIRVSLDGQAERTQIGGAQIGGAEIEGAPVDRAQVEVNRAAAVVFRAELSARAGDLASHEDGRSALEDGRSRPSSYAAEARWSGVVYLPSRQPNQGSDRHFIAEIRGATRTYAFSPVRDELGLTPGKGDHAIRELVESGFVAQSWAIRADAQHAKSKTYRSVTTA